MLNVLDQNDIYLGKVTLISSDSHNFLVVKVLVDDDAIALSQNYLSFVLRWLSYVIPKWIHTVVLQSTPVKDMLKHFDYYTKYQPQALIEYYQISEESKSEFDENSEVSALDEKARVRFVDKNIEEVVDSKVYTSAVDIQISQCSEEQPKAVEVTSGNIDINDQADKEQTMDSVDEQISSQADDNIVEGNLFLSTNYTALIATVIVMSEVTMCYVMLQVLTNAIITEVANNIP